MSHTLDTITYVKSLCIDNDLDYILFFPLRHQEKNYSTRVINYD